MERSVFILVPYQLQCSSRATSRRSHATALRQMSLQPGTLWGCAVGTRVVDGLAATKTLVDAVPEGDVVFTKFPAEVNLFPFQHAGEIHQAHVKILDHDAGFLNAIDDLHQTFGRPIVVAFFPKQFTNG